MLCSTMSFVDISFIVDYFGKRDGNDNKRE